MTTVTSDWLQGFETTYRALADVGRADAPFGAEYYRVLAAAINQGVRLREFEAFIDVQANGPPMMPEGMFARAQTVFREGKLAGEPRPGQVWKEEV